MGSGDGYPGARIFGFMESLVYFVLGLLIGAALSIWAGLVASRLVQFNALVSQASKFVRSLARDEFIEAIGIPDGDALLQRMKRLRAELDDIADALWDLRHKSASMLVRKVGCDLHDATIPLAIQYRNAPSSKIYGQLCQALCDISQNKSSVAALRDAPWSPWAVLAIWR